MARKIIDIGAVGNDGTGDSIRDSFRKVNDNFRELYSSLGLGERLTFLGLSDTPDLVSYDGLVTSLNATPIVTVNNEQNGIMFKKLTAGLGVNFDYVSNPDEIKVTSTFNIIETDPNPTLGGDLSAISGVIQRRIINLGTTETPLQPLFKHEAVNKAYADSKVSLSGIDAIDPGTGLKNSQFGIMSGPLILSRDPQLSDDEAYSGLIAATKRYVDNAAFGSSINLYVAKSGADYRPGVSDEVQGRALAYAYSSLEYALKRAEDDMLSSRLELGPYAKTLTYDNGANECTLSSIEAVPNSGVGFTGQVLMTIDSFKINSRGFNYTQGDIITVSGGDFSEPAKFEVLSTLGSPGAIISAKLITGGSYSLLPGNIGVPTIELPPGNSATFDLTYKVSKVNIISQGTGYGLVSVRIIGGGGTGAFGTAEVLNTAIQGITITDAGSNFSSLPNVLVNLPRFAIFTNGLRTDFTGDVVNPTIAASRTRDIREGLYLKGNNSNALAQILSHNGVLDGDGNELFDMDIKYGSFELGETIAYGDIANTKQITILVESGIYEENLPLRVPANVSIVGDEFRRVLIRPKAGDSTSPWAFINFRRDPLIDNLTIASQPFGYHYLSDVSFPIYSPINNKGFFNSAAQLLSVNRDFLKREIIAWVNYQISNSVSPFTSVFTFNQVSLEKSIAFIVDSMIYDLKWGESDRTISTALKFHNAELFDIETSLAEFVATLTHLKSLITSVIKNQPIDVTYQLAAIQIIDPSYTAESSSVDNTATVINATSSNPVVITTASNHGFLRGEKINIANVTGMAEINGNFYVSVVDQTTFELYSDPGLLQAVNGLGFSSYVSGGLANNLGGVSTALLDASLDIIQDINVVNMPKSNDSLDMFMCNDAVRFQAMGMQGQGGFAMVLDPTGQILSKSPYAQECSSFSRSINKQTFAGGMFIDGFSGNLQFQITSKDSDTFLRVSGLTRFPQLPASFIVNDIRYRINYVRDFSFNTEGSTASFVLDETTPWPFPPDSRIHEVLMPGNRSMLANDFTQINDMGYGILATNSGLCEAVSVFTYYCYTSMYSLNGAQIRSISSSSAHGVYALVAEGADPLEVPTPVTNYFDFSQGVTCYFPSPSFANTVEGVVIYVSNYKYVPLNNSEIEIDHGPLGIFRYGISAVSTDALPVGVARLSLDANSGFGSSGLVASVPNNTKMTIRQLESIVLTGNVVNVATRPSTGLVFEDTEEVYRILQFDSYTDSTGAKTATISIGNPAIISNTAHELLPNYQIKFSTSGVLPAGIVADTVYYVLTAGFSQNSFRISAEKQGTPIQTSGTQSGIHKYTVEGLAVAILRENYNYVEITTFPLQPFRATRKACTISIGNPGVVTLASHGFSAGDVIRFETEGVLPTGIIESRQFWVQNVVDPDTFVLSDTPTGGAIETSGTQSGIHYTERLLGIVGDSTYAVSTISSSDSLSILVGSKLVWIGEEYSVIGYQSTAQTGKPYGLITLNRPLEDSVINYTTPPTLKSALSKNQAGTLTIRISLTRVTSHDLLEIGTGSYADTNFPNEIYGSPVNTFNAANEVKERSVGRVFYATTDQFGNFSVGPYFRVDQGTGKVTLSSTVTLSKLDGIGFKRGVPVSEFSIDTGFSDNAVDSVPTELATRTYIERRLGITHNGAIVDGTDLIPLNDGGYMPLNGLLAMKSNMNLGDKKIIELANPSQPKDAVNLQSLTFDNFQNTTITTPDSADLLAFTGTGKSAVNVSVIGDVSFNLSASPNTIDVQINDGAIVNSNINNSAAILQSKLSMNSTSTRANATDIAQADLGLASVDSAQFNSTSGWISVKDNGLTLSKLQTIPQGTVLGNSTIETANVTAVTFATVINQGLGIKKSQYSNGVGYLKRVSTSSSINDSDYSIVNDSSAEDPNTLVRRNINGDFSARIITASELIIGSSPTVNKSATPSGGYTQVYGFLNQAGILIGDGDTVADRKSFYYNDSHLFKNRLGTQDGSVSVGTLIASNITTGAVATAGTLTGNWSMETTSNLTVGTGSINVSTGTLISKTLSTGAASTAGVITGEWALSFGSRLQATYADLAEYYQSDKAYPAGTVLIFGGEFEVTMSKTTEDYKVAGVVSNNAAYIMNTECPGIKSLIALQGRVPCKVVGTVSKGDLMITSNIAGVAISAKGNAKAGTIIGKALENYQSDHIGTIEVAVGRT
jgi:hypothetical protein